MNEVENPWQTLQSSVPYENPWLSIRHEDVITPAGTPGIYGVVSFKNKAVGVIPIDADGNTYLVGQYRYTLNEYSWEIPEGGCPLGTLPLDTARRELKEETGLTAQTWTPIARIHTSNSATDEEGFLFIAEDLTEGEHDPEDTEQLRVWKLPLTDAVAMAMNSRITDALSVAGLLMVARLRKL